MRFEDLLSDAAAHRQRKGRIMKSKVNIRTLDMAEQYILECEKAYEQLLIAASDAALSEKCRLIALAGPTCSGKTTTARLLSREIEAAGHRAVVMSIDDFYRDNLRAETEDGSTPDFDSANTIDLEYLSSFTEALFAGETVRTPVFEFVTGKRTGYREYSPDPRDIYIFEGIQAVYPEVTRLFGDMFTSIFICVSDGIEVCGTEFDADEIRLLRRIVRDYLFRNASPAFTLKCWGMVRANEEMNIFPHTSSVRVRINSFLGYEIFLLAKYAIPLLETVPKDDPNYRDAETLCARLVCLTDRQYFHPYMVPSGSMFREFIGSDSDAVRIGI